jgi:hypothetical protein
MTDIDNKSVTAAYRRKAIRQEELRGKLRARAYLRLLERIAAKATTIKPEEVPAYRLRADIYMKLLNKALPDQKAIEQTHQGPGGAPIVISSVDAKL